MALQKMIRDLGDLDETIRLFDADFQSESIRPKAFRPPDDWAQQGRMTGTILDVLREAAEPLTTRDEGVQLIAERASDAGNASWSGR